MIMISRRRRQRRSAGLSFAFFALSYSLSSIFSKHGVGDAWWQVRAQNTGGQRTRRSSSIGGQQRPNLHNQNHESTIRNILSPKFENKATNSLPSGNHTSNVAIVVSSSRYWFNYRHVTNALSIYHLLKRGGITDDNIVLMLADDIPCNMRNPIRGKIFSRGTSGGDLMEGVEIDYSGTDVTVDAFMRVLLGRPLPGENGMGVRSFPNIDENTNVLVYLTGHGGDNFFKFQDGEELMSNDIASAFSQMYELKRYNELLFISDTCQAFTMADEIKVPNVFSVGSSLRDDVDVGQSVIDRYSKAVIDFVDDSVTMTTSKNKRGGIHENQSVTFDDATVEVMKRLNLHDAIVRIPMNHGDLGPNSKVGYADHLCSRRMNKVPLGDFFAATSAEREGQVDRNRGVKASLWMGRSPRAAKEERSRKVNDGEGEMECAIDGSKESNDDTEKYGDETKPQQPQQKGISQSHPKFIAMAVGFLLCIRVSSLFW